MRNEDGFSLVEAIVAIAVIGIIAIAIYDLLASPFSRRAEALKDLERLMTAKQILSQVEAWQTLAPGERQVANSDQTNWTVRIANVEETSHLRRIEVLAPGEERPVLTTLLRVRGK